MKLYIPAYKLVKDNDGMVSSGDVAQTARSVVGNPVVQEQAKKEGLSNQDVVTSFVRSVHNILSEQEKRKQRRNL